jgi:DNA-binding transcriptional regulator YiaG
LAIAQRTITVCRKHISTNRSPKKAIPTLIQTLGDYLLLKRFEKGLSQRQVAQRVDVTILTVKQWEGDRQTPTEAEWLALKDLLNLTEWPSKS